MSGRGPFGNNNFGTDFFFGDAFSHMDRMMSSMLNDPFFANSMGVGFRPYGANLPYQNQDSRARQPVIEEVDDMGVAARTETAQDEPIVEEPDDDCSYVDQYVDHTRPHPACGNALTSAAEPSSQDRAAQRQRRHSPPRQPGVQAHVPVTDPFSQLFGGLLGAGGGGSSSFMMSSYNSMGPGGVTYQASRTTRVGPGGVQETQGVVRDSRTGTESVTISRGLGDGRQRTLVRTRDATTGREEQLEDLQGLQEHEADTFDEQWRQHAERNLPGGGFITGSGRVGGGRSGNPTQQRPLALMQAGSPTPGIATTGSNAGLATAQRAAYARQPNGGSSHYGGRGTGQGRGGAGEGGYVAPRSQGSVQDGQYGSRQQQPQSEWGGNGRASGYAAGGDYAQSRYGY